MEQRHYTPLLYQIVSPFILTFVTLLTYFPSLTYEPQFDDLANITKYFHIRDGTLSNLFFSGSRWISYWLNSTYYKFIRFDPLYYRIGNVVIHIANGIIIFFILLTIFKRLPRQSFFTKNRFSISCITALIFLLHPVQTQTVSYIIQGQLEGLATLSILSMVLCFLWINYGSTLTIYFCLFPIFFAFCFLSTGTKEIAIVGPFLVLLVDWFFVARGNLKKLKSRWWFHAIVISIVLGTYVYFLSAKFFANLLLFNLRAENNLGNIITSNYTEAITPFYFFISQFKVILHYVWIYVWPYRICVEYDWVLTRSIFEPDCIFPFIALCTLGYALWKILRQNSTSVVCFAALWFAIAIAPRSSFMPSPELLADYKTYPASFGIILLLSSAFVWLFEHVAHYMSFRNQHYQQYTKIILTLCLAVVLSTHTMLRNTVWSSGLNFWGNIVQNAPGKPRAYNNYGVELAQKLGKYTEAIPYYQRAISMDKRYRDPYNNLAVSYASTKQLDKAIDILKQSLKIYPNYPEAYNNIGSFLIEKKEYATAEKSLRVAIELNPHYGKAYFNLGRLYMELKEPEKGWSCFKNACMKADFDNESGFIAYAQSSLLVKKYEDAIYACKKILELNPRNRDAAFNLANVYFIQEKYGPAEELYTQLLKTNPRDATIAYNLAETYFKLEKTQLALEYFTRVKSVPGISLTAFTRIAACYEKLGNVPHAKLVLEELLGKNLPQEARKTIESALANLKARYKMA